mgnify:CR=1 FL=1
MGAREFELGPASECALGLELKLGPAPGCGLGSGSEFKLGLRYDLNPIYDLLASVYEDKRIRARVTYGEFKG